MRLIFTALALVTLGACTQVPDSAAGVGFDNSLEQQRAREAALAQQQAQVPLPPANAISDETFAAAPGVRQPTPTVAGTLPPASPVTAAPSEPLSALQTPPVVSQTVQQPQDDAILQAAASLDETAANSGVPPVQASPSNPPPQIIGNPGISDENDFQAVSQRETIESDALRIEQNRSQYQQVQPTAVPARTSDGQPNIVQYALETRHPRGTRVYSRTGINLAARSARNCAGFASSDLAQIEFLASGGPRRDRKALDPDGDGYACSWDPAPFRSAVQN